MADTPSTGNTTPTVDPAAPTDTAQSTGETVQLAQAVVVLIWKVPSPTLSRRWMAGIPRRYIGAESGVL